ncbi:unnamed protein product [Orchesella dallaii]|uniref:Peptidase metallopeptidase domain-containing protein n=1 Tax=Orchesella dallaii TaxID=48710 RepID=A0ABP1PS00_9HEXA
MWNCVQIVLIIATVGSGYEIKSRHEALMYLNRFGYVNDEDVSDQMNASDLKPMLVKFQKMCNINQTGMLDAKTMDMMNAPRCGNLDINETEHHTMFLQEMGVNEVDIGRYRRYTLNENGLTWKKRELTYKMGMFSAKMGSHVSRDAALEEIHQAFKIWSEVTNLDFIYRPNDPKVDIDLSFTVRFHKQDQYPFDGPGKTLAHAFPPGEGVLGDVHFEDEEDWTVKTPKGINVLFVATHEIGHALGLTHSMVKGAVMQPFYGGYSPKLQLHSDDIAGVQSMYGKRETRQHKPTTTSTVKPFQRPYPTPAPSHPETTRRPNIHFPTKEYSRPDLCKDSSIDAITTLPDETVYAFKGTCYEFVSYALDDIYASK